MFMHPMDWQDIVMEENAGTIPMEAFPETQQVKETQEVQEFPWIAEALEGKEEILEAPLPRPRKQVPGTRRNVPRPHKDVPGASVSQMRSYITEWYKRHRNDEIDVRVYWINNHAPRLNSGKISWTEFTNEELQGLYIAVKVHPFSLYEYD